MIRPSQVVNSLERRKDMMLDNQPVRLLMLQDVWNATRLVGPQQDGGGLKASKLTLAHFEKNPLTRMNVRLAVQVLSNTMYWLCTVLLLRVNAAEHRRLSPLFPPILRLVQHMNHLVDVCNTRVGEKKLNIDLIDGPSHRHVGELLHASAFLARWKLQAMSDAVLDYKEKTRPKRWLTKEAGDDAIGVGLGVAALAAMHARPDFKLRLRRLDQDCAENHFANLRHRAKHNGCTSDVCKAGQQAANVNRFGKSVKSNASGAAPAPMATSRVFDQRTYKPTKEDKQRESQHVFY